MLFGLPKRLTTPKEESLKLSSKMDLYLIKSPLGVADDCNVDCYIGLTMDSMNEISSLDSPYLA